MNKTNEKNELVNDCVPKTFNTFSDMREYVEETNISKISLNSTDQKRIRRMKYINKKFKSMLDNDNDLSVLNIFEGLYE